MKKKTKGEFDVISAILAVCLVAIKPIYALTVILLLGVLLIFCKK